MKVRIRFPEWLQTFSNRQCRFFEGELDPATGLLAVEREGEYGSTQPVTTPYSVHIGSGAVMQVLEPAEKGVVAWHDNGDGKGRVYTTPEGVPLDHLSAEGLAEYKRTGKLPTTSGTVKAPRKPARPPNA